MRALPLVLIVQNRGEKRKHGGVLAAKTKVNHQMLHLLHYIKKRIRATKRAKNLR